MRNDPSEVKFASKIFTDCIEDLLDLELMNEPEADRLKKSVAYTDEVRMIVLNERDKVFRPKNIHMTPYVVCFSRSYDDSMWKEYEATGALELKITQNSIYSHLRGEDKGREPIDQDSYVKLLKVQYDSPETRRKLRKLIMKAKAVGDINKWCEVVHGILMECRLGIKPAEFEHENEYRIVYLMPKIPKKNDPALRYVCKTHYDMIENEVVENAYDPQKDEYIWLDISEFIWGVTLRESNLDEKHLIELSGMGDIFCIGHDEENVKMNQEDEGRFVDCEGSDPRTLNLPQTPSRF